MQAPRANSLLKINLKKELYPTAVSSNYTVSYNLNEYIEWTTDIAGCHASNVSLCDDEACTALSTDTKVALAANPTNKDASGIVSPVLIIDRRTAFAKYIFIQGTRNDGTVKGVVKVHLIVCGQESIELADPENKTAIHVSYKGEAAKDEYDQFDLTGIFKVVSASESVLAVDCPLHYIAICEETVATCSATTSLSADQVFVDSSSGRFILNVVTTKVLVSGQWKMTAYTESGQSLESTVDVTACGNEVIEVNYKELQISTGQKLTIQRDMDTQPGIVKYTLADMFTNSLTECKIVGYAIVTKPEIPSEEG